jgi:lysophospholipase L1-like esterase
MVFKLHKQTPVRQAGKRFLLAGIVAFSTVALAVPESGAISGSSGETGVVPNSVQVHEGFAAQVSGRKITVSPGSCWVEDRPIRMKQARVVELPPCTTVPVNGEPLVFGKDFVGNEFAILPGCMANNQVKLGVADVLVPQSLVLRSSQDASGKTYVAGKDYNVSTTGSVTKVKGGTLQGVKTCYASYSVNMHRVDTIAVDETGNLRFATGKQAKWAAVPPVVPADFLPLYNVYSYTGKNIAADDIMGISHEPMPIMLTKQREKNKEALKETLEKLKQGKAVKVAIWGDSITYGTGASTLEASYVSLFAKRLRQKYPKAEIIIDREGLSNANTALRGSTFYQDVLCKNPDIVIIEFLNDMLFPARTVGDRYVQLFKAVKIVKADCLIIAPHLPSPNFVPERGPNGNGSLTYSEMLRNLVATDTNTAFCDVAARWEHLPKEGFKRESFLVDGVHPSDRGHEMYAEELMKCF